MQTITQQRRIEPMGAFFTPSFAVWIAVAAIDVIAWVALSVAPKADLVVLANPWSFVACVAGAFGGGLIAMAAIQEPNVQQKSAGVHTAVRGLASMIAGILGTSQFITYWELPRNAESVAFWSGMIALLFWGTFAGAYATYQFCLQRFLRWLERRAENRFGSETDPRMKRRTNDPTPPTDTEI